MHVRRWRKIGADADHIASIMVSDFDRYTRPVEQLFRDDVIPYSGVVSSNNDASVQGSKIEKSCYSKGGLKFLYRSYTETDIGDPGFPLKDLHDLIVRVSKLYVADVVGRTDDHALLDLCWAVCQREGDYGTLHNHVPPGGESADRYSGMFYLRTPDAISPDNFPNGCLHIITASEIVYFPPIPGSIIFWPAHLIHGIHPFRGEGDRLGIAFDIVVK